MAVLDRQRDEPPPGGDLSAAQVLRDPRDGGISPRWAARSAAARGAAAGARHLDEVEQLLMDALPGLGTVVDVLRSGSEDPDFAVEGRAVRLGSHRPRPVSLRRDRYRLYPC